MNYKANKTCTTSNFASIANTQIIFNNNENAVLIMSDEAGFDSNETVNKQNCNKRKSWTNPSEAFIQRSRNGIGRMPLHRSEGIVAGFILSSKTGSRDYCTQFGVLNRNDYAFIEDKHTLYNFVGASSPLNVSRDLSLQFHLLIPNGSIRSFRSFYGSIWIHNRSHPRNHPGLSRNQRNEIQSIGERE